MTPLPEPPGSSSQRLTPLHAAPPRPWVRPAAAVLALGVAASGVALWLAWKRADWILARVCQRWSPLLEKQVGLAMGRPLELGSCEGWGPEGLRLGPSRFLPGPLDGSSARARALVVRLDPLASWRDRSLHLTLDLEGAEVEVEDQRR